MTSPYLTKSKFKIGTECQTKLFYARNKKYQNNRLDDDFLKALAEGGFQVGEYARQLFPGGHEITESEHDVALAKTNELLQLDEVVIFEAAVVFENLFVRVDVLEKKGSVIKLYEVKSKSCKGTDESQLLGKKVPITAEWRPYLEDIAFQQHVVSSAFPLYTVKPHLMLMDKNAVSPNDGLHQKFILRKDAKGNTTAKTIQSLSPEELTCDLLVPILLEETMDVIFKELTFGPQELCFTDWIKHLAAAYQTGERQWVSPTKDCKKCEFKANKTERDTGKESGFHECWKHHGLLRDETLDAPTVLDIWKYRKKQEHLDRNEALLSSLTGDPFDSAPDHSDKFTISERQRLQVVKSQQSNPTRELRMGLAAEMSGWVYPYNFIDFETMSPAIPIHKDHHPYDSVAFQYSHHILHEDGRVEHKNQFIFKEIGKFPSIKFVEALQAALGENSGTIFRYHNHENTILRSIRARIIRDGESAKRNSLISFIDSITQPTGKESLESLTGERNMVDLHAMVKSYYYDPLMGGSVSIKHVLPAVMKTSEFIQNKYACPIGDINVSSLNFPDNWVWLKDSGDQVKDPYSLLPTLFNGQSELLNNQKRLYADDDLKNGGAAMTAYAKMQYSQMPPEEKTELEGMLLKYCELDTLAMVMIIEAWQHWLPNTISINYSDDMNILA
jgi:hypothetical protein